MKTKSGLPALIFVALFAPGNSMMKTGHNKVRQVSNGQVTTVATGRTVPYTIAQRYFVNNTYHDGDLADPKITSQAEFNKFFSAAAIMGKNGRPTKIDFT